MFGILYIPCYIVNTVLSLPEASFSQDIYSWLLYFYVSWLVAFSYSFDAPTSASLSLIQNIFNVSYLDSRDGSPAKCAMFSKIQRTLYIQLCPYSTDLLY